MSYQDGTVKPYLLFAPCHEQNDIRLDTVSTNINANSGHCTNNLSHTLHIYLLYESNNNQEVEIE